MGNWSWSAALRSSRLTLVVLFLLAILSATATIPRRTGSPQVPGAGSGVLRFLGIESTFSSPVFIALAGIMIANILFCSIDRFSRARRNRKLLLPDMIMHLSLVLVFAGGVVKGTLGSVRTVNVSVGDETTAAFDWKSGVDIPLGFTLRLVRFETEHYPFRALVGARLQASGEKIGLAEVVEGQGAAAFSKDGEIALAALDRAAGTAVFTVRVDNVTGSMSLALSAGPGATAEFGGRIFTLVAFRDEERSVRALVNAVRGSEPISEKWLSTNDRLEIEGTKVFLTAWGRDEFQKRFCGFQITRDPGAPLFWIGCILLSGATPLHFAAKRWRRREESGK